MSMIEIESNTGHGLYTYDPNKSQQGGMTLHPSWYQDPYAIYPNGTGTGWTYPVRDNPFEPPPFGGGSRKPDFPAIHPYGQDKQEEGLGLFKEWLKTQPQPQTRTEKNEKKELRFTISPFPTPNNERDNVVFVYLWNGKDWVWDWNKDDIVASLSRYPLKLWKWSSVDE